MVVIPSKMGRLNKRTLLWRLHRLGVASRADLARSLGMSHPTAGKIADELLEMGVLEEVSDDGEPGPAGTTPVASARSRLGRPGRRLRLSRGEPRFLGIQLGVSRTSLTPLPVGADSEDRWAVEVDTPPSAVAWTEELRRASGRLPTTDYWGVLVSVPGIVDERSGRVWFSPNLHWTETVDLADLIGRVWHAPVVLVQEERALALGHQYLAPHSEDFLLVDFGDGVGGAAIVGGKLHESPLPLSGELGHTPVPGGQRRCGCGGMGCLETLISTRGLLQSHAEQHSQPAGSWSALRDAIQLHGLEPWLVKTLDIAAGVIAGSLNVLGLNQLVVTGSLTDLPGTVMDRLATSIRRGALWARFGQVKVQSAPRRRTAGLVAVALDRVVLPRTGLVDVGPALVAPGSAVA